MKTLTYNDRTAIYEDIEIEQKVSIIIPDGTIAISLSGGLDSTALLFLIGKYITDLKLENKIKLKPVHSVSKQLSNSLAITQKIVDDFTKRYHNVITDDLEIFGYDETIYKTSTKNAAHNIFYNNLYKDNPDLKSIITALTSLPERNIAESWGVEYFDERRVNKVRDVHVIYEQGAYAYKPFINNNKKLISSLHKFLNLNVEYIKETWSCTFYSNRTKNFTEPCKKCYHCLEKYWAFGQY